MKIKLLTFSLLFSFICFSQNGSAYKQLEPVKDDLGKALQKNSEISEKNRKLAIQIAEERRQKNINAFNQSKTDAFKAFNLKNFSRCIYYYESSRKMGWYDAEFEYIAGVSYYNLWKELKKKKYKSKAKKILKLSKKHGYIDAELFLDKYF
ncbi:hypothetical protein [Mesoflavibacter sp. CH_XMU1422-2]|uniref:hypothetical protein n=1 Tax=Mesoflavibacter sp. CH_XMU1422-2 TaxID=3107770 RepID=UPI00300A002D